MKIHTIVVFTLVSLFIGSFNSFGSPLDKKILELKPQADRNGDGKLSDAERKNLIKMIISRFPRSDADGDGTLSEKEWEVVIRIATARDKMQKRQNSGKTSNQGQMAPTHANIKYGEHERNVFDLWLAESKTPTPLAIYIHGGGFISGNKEKVSQQVVMQLLDAGISVASINYRYLSIETPLPTSHHDARRALQFIRSKAEEWNIDKSRVAAFGGSAGAHICMWLAYSDDMAKPKRKDP
ncbi:MAG: alpha/beta hydrolase fold domain-containing protein, partial [Opitutae bacterium]|nr:alpha/beta hydrolase fold domain-containing protein [Opitutae bacterium]